MRIQMIVFGLFMSLSFLCWADLGNVSKGLDIQEKIHFSSADQCRETVTTALNNTGYTVEKAETYEQGPTIWGTREDQTHKSMTKCMLRYDLLITFVIGKKDNLPEAVNLNKEIQKVVAGGGTKRILRPQPKDAGETTEEENLCEGNFTQWGDFTRFSFVRKIETPKGFLILKAPAKNAEVVRKSQDASLFVIGYLQTKEDKFYVTKYSCERYENGDDPYWYVLR